MGNLHPYLQRRGNRLFFRISVPAALRPLVGMREFTTSLKTGERAAAVPLALELGATAHRLFHDLTNCMSNKDMLKLLADAKAKLRIDEVRAEMAAEIEEAHRARISALQDASRQRGADRQALLAQVATLQDALDRALSARSALPHPTPMRAPADAPAGSYPVLSALVAGFLNAYAKDRKVAMFKKHQAALALLDELHGSKPINQIKQADVVDYFNVVEGLPPRWAEKCKKRGMTARALAAEEHLTGLGKKTFEDNYEVPVRLFLKWARLNWQDQGFPTTLTTEGIEFSGEDDEGRNKQRAMNKAELSQLFHGAPQADVRISADGIDHIVISADTVGDARLRKSVMTGDKREVPLHPDLLAGGFLDYVKRVRQSGSKLLFPAWSPTNARASTQAERWFRDLLRATGMRDETPGARLVGFHAFRHTLLTLAANSDPAVDAGPITGHSDLAKGGSQRGYEGDLSLSNKLKILTSIQFGFRP